MAAQQSKIRIGIVGYGNLGRGVEAAIARVTDMQLVGIFTRRSPESVTPMNGEVPVHAIDGIDAFREAVDVMILCGGSKQDLPEQTPALASRFNTVDSFDTHAKIPEYFAQVDAAAQRGQKVAVISIGWDPGLFSLERLMGEVILPEGQTHTFWGKGISQGHSDAIRRVKGVKAGVQYTIPSEAAIAAVRSGSQPTLTTRQRHARVCYVVLDAAGHAEEVRNAIVTMPDYFADYDTQVHFISMEELTRDHGDMPHGGFVIRSGATGKLNAAARPGETDSQIIEYSLKLQSNPGFTASVLVAYARACHRLSLQRAFGAKTIYDVAPGLLSPCGAEELRKRLL